MRGILLLNILLVFINLPAQTISVSPERELADKRNLGLKLKWIKGTDVVIGTDSFCVAFFDINVNGCFTGEDDKLALIKYGSDSADVNSWTGTRELQPNFILGFNGKAYELTCDTSGCKPVTIKPRPDLQAPISLRIGDELPHFSVKTFKGDSADVYSFMQPGKFTYIEFWGTWCPGCRQSAETLKELNRTKGDSLVIVSLNAGDSPKTAKKFVKDNKLNWPQGYSNRQAENLLYAGDVFPYGVLIDPQARIMAFDVHPLEVGRLIKQRD